MTDAELEAEIAVALLSGSSDASFGTFHYQGKRIVYTIMSKNGFPIRADLSLYDGPKFVTQTSCAVSSFSELRTTAIAWGIGLVRTLILIRDKNGAKHL